MLIVGLYNGVKINFRVNYLIFNSFQMWEQSSVPRNQLTQEHGCGGICNIHPLGKGEFLL